MSVFKSEPALIRTAIITIVSQVLTLGITLGLLNLDGGQVAAINTAVALVSAAVAALWVRSGVTPVAAPDPEVVEQTIEQPTLFDDEPEPAVVSDVIPNDIEYDGEPSDGKD